MISQFVLLFFSVIQISYGSEFKKFHIGSHNYRVNEIEKGIWVNEECEKDCLAYQSARMIKEKKIKAPYPKGGVNPGSWSCKKAFNGKVFIAFDDEGNQQSFCKFSDGSFVNSGALY